MDTGVRGKPVQGRQVDHTEYQTFISEPLCEFVHAHVFFRHAAGDIISNRRCVTNRWDTLQMFNFFNPSQDAVHVISVCAVLACSLLEPRKWDNQSVVCVNLLTHPTHARGCGIRMQ